MELLDQRTLHAFEILIVLAKFIFQRDLTILYPSSVEIDTHFPMLWPQWIADCQSAPQFSRFVFNDKVGCPVTYVGSVLFFWVPLH